MKKFNRILILIALGFIAATAWILFIDVPLRSNNNKNSKEINATKNGDAMEKLLSEAYYKKILADPLTGKVPKNIRDLELAFASSLPVSHDSKREDIWKARGPNNLGGRTRAFGVNVDNSNELLAGSATGGVFKSIDGGLNWYKTQCPVNAITCLVQDIRPGKTNIWYAGSGELTGSSGSAGGAYYYGEGILKSIDGGETWTRLSSTTGFSPTSFDSDFDGVWNIAIDYSNTSQDEIYAAVYSGIYKSTDGGQTWKKKRQGAIGNYSYYTDVVVTSTGTVYATMSNESTHRGIWRSEDGETWTSITPVGFPSVYGRVVIGVAPSDESQVWFLACVTTNFGLVSTNFQGVKEWNSLWKYNYISGDGSGVNGRWVNRSLNLPDKGGDFGYFSTQGGYDAFVRVYPKDTNVIFVGATNLWRSKDAFRTTNQTDWIGGYAVNTRRPDFKMYPNHHPDLHNMWFMKNNEMVAYSTHDGGISQTFDITASDVVWEARNNNYITSQFYTVAVDKATNLSSLVIGGLQDNGTHFVNVYGMASWHMSLSSDGAHCAVKNGGNEIYASTQLGRIMHLEVDNIGRPLKYARIDPYPLNRTNYDFINPFALDPHNQKILYIPAKTRIFRNRDIEAKPMTDNYDSTRWDTPLWVELTNLTVPASHEISAITVSKSNPNTLFYATDRGKLYKVSRADTGQPKPVDITGSNFSSANINCINTDPLDSNKITIVFSNYNVISLFHTINGGKTWINISGNLEQNANGSGNGPSCRWAAVMPLSNGKITWFVGTSVGLYATDSLAGANTVWIKQSPKGIGNNIVTMIDTRPEDFYIAVATHGNGVFTANIANAWQITSVSSVKHPEFVIYPNPVTQQRFVLSGNFIDHKIKLTIVDASGKTMHLAVKEQMNLNEHELMVYLNDLPSGIYFLIIDQNGQRAIKRLSLQAL